MDEVGKGDLVAVCSVAQQLGVPAYWESDQMTIQLIRRITG